MICCRSRSTRRHRKSRNAMPPCGAMLSPPVRRERRRGPRLDEDFPASRLRTSVQASAFFRAHCQVARRRLPRPEGTLWPPFSFGRRGARAESANPGGEFDRNTARPRRRLNRTYMSIARRGFCRSLFALRARRPRQRSYLDYRSAGRRRVRGQFRPHLGARAKCKSLRRTYVRRGSLKADELLGIAPRFWKPKWRVALVTLIERVGVESADSRDGPRGRIALTG